MAELEIYSVLLAWSDEDINQGEFGEVVRAANEVEAEAKARAAMPSVIFIELHPVDEVEEVSGHPVPP